MNDLLEFEHVMKLYEPLIKRSIARYHLTYDFDEYEQLARIALWEAYRGYDSAKGPFPAFAQAKVRGRLLTEIKRRKRYGDMHELADQIQDTIPAKPNNDATLFEMGLNFSHLSDREKMWLEAAITKDQSTKAIAARLGVTQDTVRSWKKSAVKKLRQQLAHEI